jgi:hypothetical protein
MPSCKLQDDSSERGPVPCPLRSPPFAANAADKQGTENKGWWRDSEIAAMASNFGIGRLV